MANANLLAQMTSLGDAQGVGVLSNAMAQGQNMATQREALQNSREDRARKNELLAAFPAAIKGDPNALEAVGRADPQAYLSLQEHQTKMQEAQRAQAQVRLQRFAGAALYGLDSVEKAPEADRQNAYVDIVTRLAQMDPEAFHGLGGAPQQYDANWAKQAKTSLLPMALGDKLNDYIAKSQEPKKYNNPVSGVNPKTGKAEFRQFSDDGSSMPVTDLAPPPKNSGFSFSTNPDGTVEFSENGGPLPGMAKPTQNALEEKLVTSQAGLDRLRGIRGQFKPEYQTWEGKLQGAWSAIKDKAGVDLPAAEKQQFGEYSAYQASVLDNLNRHIKDITGASMSVQEASRITKSMPSPDDGPTAFQSKLDRTMKDLTRAQARAYYTLKNGLTMDSVGMGEIDGVIRKRGSEIEAAMKKAQPDAKDEEIKASVKKQLMREFGLGQ